MSRWCPPPDVQGRGSKTDAAQSHSCRREDKGGGEVSKGGVDRGGGQNWKDACHLGIIGCG